MFKFMNKRVRYSAISLNILYETIQYRFRFLSQQTRYVRCFIPGKKKIPDSSLCSWRKKKKSVRYPFHRKHKSDLRNACNVININLFSERVYDLSYLLSSSRESVAVKFTPVHPVHTFPEGKKKYARRFLFPSAYSKG